MAELKAQEDPECENPANLMTIFSTKHLFQKVLEAEKSCLLSQKTSQYTDPKLRISILGPGGVA